MRYNNVYTCMSCEQCRRKSLARADRDSLCSLIYSTLSHDYVSGSDSENTQADRDVRCQTRV